MGLTASLIELVDKAVIRTDGLGLSFEIDPFYKIKPGMFRSI